MRSAVAGFASAGATDCHTKALLTLQTTEAAVRSMSRNSTKNQTEGRRSRRAQTMEINTETTAMPRATSVAMEMSVRATPRLWMSALPPLMALWTMVQSLLPKTAATPSERQRIPVAAREASI